MAKLTKERYQKVLDLLLDGLSISEAVEIVGIDRSNFYKQLNLLQKKEIIVYKMLGNPHWQYHVYNYA